VNIKKLFNYDYILKIKNKYSSSKHLYSFQIKYAINTLTKTAEEYFKMTYYYLLLIFYKYSTKSNKLLYNE